MCATVRGLRQREFPVLAKHWSVEIDATNEQLGSLSDISRFTTSRPLQTINHTLTLLCRRRALSALEQRQTVPFCLTC